MKIEYVSEHEVSSEAARHATGKSLDAWFAELDALRCLAKERRALGDYLAKEKNVDAWWTVTILVEYEKARGATEKDGLGKGYNICVTKSIATPPQRLFDALLDTQAWMGPGSRAELKEDGAFEDGDGHRGVFKLTATGAKTSVVLNHERLPDRAAADGMRAAWANVLEGIKAKLG